MFVVVSEDQTSITLKAPKGVQGILVNSDPERFFVPKYVGSKGWVGVRLDLAGPPDWEEMAEIIYESYGLLAPARLVRQLETDLAGGAGDVAGSEGRADGDAGGKGRGAGGAAGEGPPVRGTKAGGEGGGRRRKP